LPGKRLELKPDFRNFHALAGASRLSRRMSSRLSYFLVIAARLHIGDAIPISGARRLPPGC
jgi:hypothetical protein